MSYTMHSPSQGYTNPSTDVYTNRGYGGHLMGHSNLNNYSSYLGRDESYNGPSSNGHHYSNGPVLQTGQYSSSSSSISHPTYPGPPPLNHFGQQQDLYMSSCMPPSRNHSYPLPQPSMVSPVNRHAINSKSYWNCEPIPPQQQSPQQSQGHCYGSNSAINSTHKSSPPAWTRSPNVISSPSSTPSPIPCPSTPHHFSPSPHHSQSHTDSHKSYNGIINNSSLISNGTSGANTIPCNNSNNNGSSASNSSSNPLQSLQKMVQIDSDNAEIRGQYENSSTVPIASQHSQASSQHTSHSISGLESESNYPTYYNLDQNRLCATPQAAYSNIQTQSLNSSPFSPSLKNSPEVRPQPNQMQSNCAKQESGSENGDLILGRANSVRYSAKLSKENSYMNNGSCSTDTGSNGSPSAQPNKIASIPDSVMHAEQTHDSINSFKGSETTANSRDSVKSSDSTEALSSYGVSQCSTPNNTWKLNEFQQRNFSSNSQAKSWWAENAAASQIRPFSSQNTADCSQYTSQNVNYPPSQVAHQMSQSNSTMPHNQSWSQQPLAIPTPGSQMGGCPSYTTDGVVIKKKRGRPFGSKNRRNIDCSTVAQNNNNNNNNEPYKRKRKNTLVDIGVNTNLSFNVQASLHHDDSLAFCETFGIKPSAPPPPPPPPQINRRKKPTGPVIRIDQNAQADSPTTTFSIVNSLKMLEDDNEAKQKSSKTQNHESSNQTRKNGLSRKPTFLSSNNYNSSVYDKNWVCILCHKGPHYKGLGDLFGPYFISLDKSNLTANSEISSNDEVEIQEQTPNERRCLRKRQESNEDKAKNASQTTTHAEERKELTKTELEVWIHEDCIVWSNNVYLEGTKIRNLEPAIRESFENICTKCKLPGATLGCIYKNCSVSPLHYLCAKEKDCDLDEENFILNCSKHKKRRVLSREPDGAEETSEVTTTATNEN